MSRANFFFSLPPARGMTGFCAHELQDATMKRKMCARRGRCAHEGEDVPMKGRCAHGG